MPQYETVYKIYRWKYVGNDATLKHLHTTEIEMEVTMLVNNSDAWEYDVQVIERHIKSGYEFNLDQWNGQAWLDNHGTDSEVS